MNEVENNKDYVVSQMTANKNKRKYNPNSVWRVFNPYWYKDQMSGWSTLSYWYLAFGQLILLCLGINGGLSSLSLTSTIAGMIGFTCTLAITNKKSINGLLGFVSALMMIVVATKTGNFSDVIMQGAYVVLLDIPVLLSSKWNGENEVIPRAFKGNDYLKTAGWFVMFFILTYGLDTVILTSPRPLIDAISATIGLVGAVLTVKRYRASYYFWLAQGLMSITLWGITASQGHMVWPMFITYILYLGNDIIGIFFSKWFKKGDK